ncbi:MAG TPA: hypothetical protein VIX59_21750 [Candidatus Binataceae bacterium]
MAVFSRKPEAGTHPLQPDVRFDGGHGLILFDGWAEHRLFHRALEAMLRRYLEDPESRSIAREWLAGTNRSSSFGFLRLCKYLGLEADYVRRGLTRWMNKVDNGLLASTSSNI